jgi:endonuclease/exonuclease/phosphatase family metal-dependent hydrolase
MHSAATAYEILESEMGPHCASLARCGSLAELLADPLYGQLRQVIEAALETPETGAFGGAAAPPRDKYRFLAWNLERGVELDGQIEALRSHPYLKTCDVLLLTETDLGMARSGNRAVAREIARELGMHYVFAPCYLNLTKGAGLEYDVPGENRAGLHGNAILSRYPLGRVRMIPLENGIDKMAGREKRIGRQAAIAAEVLFPNGTVTAVSVHLDAHSSQPHRRRQMADVVAALEGESAVAIGGDWNTSTYNSSRALYAILGFWVRVMMGVDRVIRNHYLHPDRWFERGLFRLLERHGFDYRNSNRLGEPTGGYDVCDQKARSNLGEWVPWWCFAFIGWALRNHGGRCPLKLDWFATRGLRASDPVVVPGLRRLSDHDPIGVDVRG